jgi:spoIIIJ-associated protein
MRQVEATAPTREQAITKALEQLGVEMYEVDDIKVLDEGSRGLFGLGARPVKVQVTVNKDLERPARQDDRPTQRPKKTERDDRPTQRPEKKRDDRNERKPEQPRPQQQNNDRKPEQARSEQGRPQQGQPRQEQAPRSEQPARDQNRNERGGERGDRNRNERGPNRDRNNNDRPAPQAQQQQKPREDRGPREERKPREENRPPRRDHDTPRPPRDAQSEDRAAFAQISDDQGTQAATLLAEIIAAMKIPAEVGFVRDPEGGARLEVKSEDGALLIGRKGATLSSLQYLINRMISQTEDGESLERVVVDVEGYLDRRRESLEELAKEMATKARETGRSMRLKPMSPQERRIIHLTLQDDPEIRTYSQGEALYRSVVISPREGAVAIKSAPSENREGGRPSGGGNRGLRGGARRIRPRPAGGPRGGDIDAGAFGD